HAARLAAVLTLIDDITATEIPGEKMDAAIVLAEYYANEALRLFEAGFLDPDLLNAQKVLDWLRRPETASPVTLPDIYRNGPGCVRTKAAAKKLMDILVDHGCVDPEERTSQSGKYRTAHYHVVNR